MDEDVRLEIIAMSYDAVTESLMDEYDWWMRKFVEIYGFEPSYKRLIFSMWSAHCSLN